jgi:hypothetical protein
VALHAEGVGTEEVVLAEVVCMCVCVCVRECVCVSVCMCACVCALGVCACLCVCAVGASRKHIIWLHIEGNLREKGLRVHAHAGMCAQI